MKPALRAGAALTAAALFAAPALAQSRDQIRIVGSSTVFPYTQAVAEQFAGMTGMQAPVVESTGTGGGMQIFCGGVGPDFPDITGASRAMTESEYEACAANGVDNVTEVLLGYDGLSIAHSRRRPRPRPEQGADLPGARLRGRGRRPDRRQPLQDLERDRPVAARRADPGLRPAADLGHPRRLRRAGHARGLRGLPGDRRARGRPQGRGLRAHAPGRPVHRGRRERQPDRAAPRRPTRTPLGIFGYSFLFENTDKLKAVAVDGVAPDADTIASGDYAVSRPLFIYVKNAHRGVIPGLDEFLAEYVSEESFGPDGYLPERGLIPLADAEREQVRAAVADGAKMARCQLTAAGPRRAPRAPAAARRDRRVLGYLFLDHRSRCALAAYFVGQTTGARLRRRRRQPVHSLPSYHGAFVAIWVGVPALVLVLLWLLLQGSVIDGLLLAQPARQPDRRRDAGAAEPAPLRDPQRRRRPDLPRADPRDRRRRRAAEPLDRPRPRRACSSSPSRSCSSASSSPAPASPRASAPATASSARSRSSWSPARSSRS